MSGYQWAALGIVLLVALLIFGMGWQACAWCRDRAAELDRRAAERAELDRRAAEERAPLPTYRGWIEGSDWERWRGAADPQFALTRRAAEIDNTADQLAVLRAEMWAEQWRREIPR